MSRVHFLLSSRPNVSIYQLVDTAVKRPNNVKVIRSKQLWPRNRKHENFLGLFRAGEPLGLMILVPLDHAALRQALEAAGFRCTPQRLAIYDYLSQAEGHPTAEEIFQAVRPSLPKISLATVYKALEVLVALGAASRLTGFDETGSARYDARTEDHYHFRCLRTGAVHDLPTRFDPELITKLDPDLTGELERKGFRVTGYRLELVGYEELDTRPFARSSGHEPTADVPARYSSTKPDGRRA